MKRLGLTLVAAACLSATAFAAGNQPTPARWEGNINVGRLSQYLRLNSKQYDEVSHICEYFNQQMKRASTSKKAQDKKTREAVYGHLKLMKTTLTQKQYVDYVKVLNITLKNKGIEIQ